MHEQVMMKPITLHSDYMVMKGNMLHNVGCTPMAETFKCENGFSVSLCIVYVYMCIIVCVLYVEMHSHAHVWACTWRPQVDFAVILQAPATLVFETGQPLAWNPSEAVLHVCENQAH